MLALRRASDAFAGAVHFPVLRTENDKVLLRCDGSRNLILPARPVEAASVQLDGGEVEVAGESPGSPLLLDRRLGILSRAAGWPDRDVVLVTYTHGYPEDKIPGDIQDAVLERASYVAETLGFVDSESKGPFSRSFGVTQQWVDTVERYRIGVGDRS